MLMFSNPLQTAHSLLHYTYSVFSFVMVGKQCAFSRNHALNFDFFFFFFLRQGLMYPSWPQTHLADSDLEPLSLLSAGITGLCHQLGRSRLGMDPRALWMPCKHFDSRAKSSAFRYEFWARRYVVQYRLLMLNTRVHHSSQSVTEPQGLVMAHKLWIS